MSIETILVIVIISGVILMNILIGKSKKSKRDISERRKRILRRFDEDKN